MVLKTSSYEGVSKGLDSVIVYAGIIGNELIGRWRWNLFCLHWITTIHFSDTYEHSDNQTKDHFHEQHFSRVFDKRIYKWILFLCAVSIQGVSDHGIPQHPIVCNPEWSLSFCYLSKFKSVTHLHKFVMSGFLLSFFDFKMYCEWQIIQDDFPHYVC